MKKTGLLLLFLAALLAAFQTVHAQDDQPLALVMTADGPVMPPMLEYIKRGIQTAEQRNAEVLIIQLNTPGGDLLTTLDIIGAIRASTVPVVVYVAPRNAIAGSAGALITVSAHASAMAPETVIGASTPINSSGEDLPSDERAKATNASRAAIRDIVAPRGEQALKLAESMIEEERARERRARDVGARALTPPLLDRIPARVISHGANAVGRQPDGRELVALGRKERRGRADAKNGPSPPTRLAEVQLGQAHAGQVFVHHEAHARALTARCTPRNHRMSYRKAYVHGEQNIGARGRPVVA